VFILTEHTPNPDAMKFTPDARLTDGTSSSHVREAFDEQSSALAARLFALPGVSRVYVAADFVTITRAADGPPWAELRYPAITAIADHLESRQPAVAEGASDKLHVDHGSIDQEIRDVLDRHVQPGVARDGGEILFDRFEPDTGVLWIRMQGACGGCRSARLTLKAGVEAIVRRFVPEVSCVQDSAGEGGGPPAATRAKGWLRSLAGHHVPPRRTRFTHAGRDMPKRSTTLTPSDAPAPVKAD
jgi:NFU1 iron-sulfur cluster scaffold homolog, mitochondrial